LTLLLLQLTLLFAGIQEASALLNTAGFIYSELQAGGRDNTIKRVRHDVNTMHAQLGDYYTRRAYRMTKRDFSKLVCTLSPHMKARRHGPNGPIPKSLAISAALRYFAGGSPYDIMLSHGLSHSALFHCCVWPTVDAINSCPSLKIQFPTSHDVQREVAKGFCSVSEVDFDCCVGAIDGIIIWTEKPFFSECERLQCGAARFFCGRKSKFGLNMQAVCDSHSRFLEVWITHPASSSDFLSFITSDFYQRLETPGFLAPGLVIFGDNAYVNNRYMASPYKQTKGGEAKDDYNFFHSQCRIRIECSFGILVQRWAMLRRALPARLGIAKQTSLTMALCRLHNFCIDRELERQSEKVAFQPAPSLVQDELLVADNGGVDFEANDDSPLGTRCNELLDGGDHFDDIDADHVAVSTPNDCHTPRDGMRRRVLESGLHRPLVNGC
jgi:hypothetical protein